VHDAVELRVSAKGRVRLSKAMRSRWGLKHGGAIVLLDLGDAALLVRGDIETLRRKLMKSATVDGSDPGRDPDDDSRQWPPDSDERIRFSVAGDVWEMPWGRHDEFGTPAYWIHETIDGGYTGDDAFETMDLKTATVWGLLHGHGVVAEVADAYLGDVMALLKKDENPSAAAVAEVLAAPIEGYGLYRFPNKKAEFISEAVSRLRSDPPPDAVHALRGYLMGLKGVGPKTAALIESRVRGPHAEVHVNDIHLRRALRHCGVFRAHWDADRHYDRFEAAFLQYARHGNVPPGALDSCIWDWARNAGSSAFDQSG